MISLMPVELRRLLSRRLFKALTILTLLGFVVAGTILFFQTDDSPETSAGVQAETEAAVSNCISEMQRIEEVDAEGLPPEARSDPEGFCRRQMTASDPRFRYADLPPVLRGLAVPLMMLGWLIGASSMGAEWHNRTITSLLTWEPRRVRALVAKMAAAAMIVWVWVALLQVAFLVAMYPTAALRGTLEGVDQSWWAEVGGLLVRGGLLAAVAAVLGLSIATVGRNTAAALGVGFVYLAVVENLIRAFKPEWRDWLIGENIDAFIQGAGGVSPLEHSWVAAGVLVLAYTAAIFCGALVFFKRAEVA
jgi:ABC-2 type transport system permease protein